MRPAYVRRAVRPHRHPVGTIVGVYEEHQHRNISGGGARAAVFGISDGLVSNVSLILGMAGAHVVGRVGAPGRHRRTDRRGVLDGHRRVRVDAGPVRADGARAGRRAARPSPADPEDERRELAALYRSRGIEPDLADELSVKMMRDPDLALETHAREELGFTPGETGKPLEAAVSSFVMFAIGALIPLLPWLFTERDHRTVVVGRARRAVASLAVGAALSLFTGRSWLWSATRQLLISAAAAAVTYSIGHLVGAG